MFTDIVKHIKKTHGTTVTEINYLKRCVKNYIPVWMHKK